jgi:hypothetical protein
MLGCLDGVGEVNDAWKRSCRDLVGKGHGLSYLSNAAATLYHGRHAAERGKW